MVNFTAYIKNSSGDWEQLKGKTAFTLSNSALLDERLDEGYLHVIGSPIECYKPTSEIKVSVYDGVEEKSFYYIIGSDRSQELPNGSGKYTHEIHLLERTKLLEGIYCQSLTFTNDKGNTYEPGKQYADPEFVSDLPEYDSELDTYIRWAFESVVKGTVTSPYKLPSADDIANKITEYMNADNILRDFTCIATENGTKRIITVTDSANNVIAQTKEGDIPLDQTMQELEVSSVSGTNVIEYNFILIVKEKNSSHPDNTPADIPCNVKYYIAVVNNQYPLKPWTITDCINRCLELAEPLYRGDAPKYRLQGTSIGDNSGNTSNNYDRGSLAEKYDKIRAPEFSLTECTLREQLKTIGGFIHAEPRLGGYINGQYYANIIFFDEYGAGEQSLIGSKPYVYKSFSHDINEYCTELQTSASNVVNRLNYAQGVISDPNETNYRTIRTENTNAKISDGDDAYVETQERIYDIANDKDGVFVTIYNSNGNAIIENVDITPYVFEWHEYQNLSSYDDAYPYAKRYAIYYKRGEKGLRGLWFKTPNVISAVEAFENYSILNIINAVTGENYRAGDISWDYGNLAFKVKYIPIYDTKFSHSKQTIDFSEKPFSRIYNQSENLLETRWFGESVKGAAQRLGNVEQNRTYLLKYLSEIPRIGDKIGDYFIAEVKCEFQPIAIKCQIALTKDFNRWSQYVGISSNKRTYEISESETYNRNVLLKNYIVVSNPNRDIFDYGTPLLSDISPIKRIFFPTNGIQKPINAVIATGYSKKFTDSRLLMLPVISSAFGNAMVFSYKYKDNYSAGTEATKKDSATWQTDVPYGDYYGRAWWYAFSLYSNLANGGIEQAETIEYKIPSFPASIISTPSPYRLRKDNREALTVNYELEFVTTENDIVIGSALAHSCDLVSGTTYTESTKVYLFNKQISKFGNTIDELSSSVIGQATLQMVDNNEGGITLRVIIPGGIVGIKSWAILTPTTKKTQTVEDESGKVTSIDILSGGEVLLARNKDFNSATTDTVNFTIIGEIHK